MNNQDQAANICSKEEIDMHIAAAKQMRSDYISALCSDLITSIKHAFHFKSHKMISSH
ncbi:MULTISPECIES: hypothetical protein [unclassified Oceanobacter]|jgi:hypothetical protein|uniref:hypothetical protein n=1 Tax=unclassified Oceanobacter TaxID=2620260 RepID=UPI0026E23941|nr:MULTISPECIES: hypothetical protein [unclassified Oceanobacter]MDO6683123.1 hypothetical protein [Oceanobacter sp. 5_MG-2023]MDP2505930.1 hypothetical protein [Oceanobacter sp. 3_MG-2023]MDP2547817.1 hypothetical protein [Oceanobacter sp. 4_MG-2023]MDP2608408.1 hypothetical protein [Oceanobacter sp. 1_MG-2023]MDP2611503.1 hypothetical protein [Oceanobacter sp. 2_MG-2023]